MKRYSPKSGSGLSISSGIVESISEDRHTITLKTSEWKNNPETKKSESVSVSVTAESYNPISDDIKVGERAVLVTKPSFDPRTNEEKIYACSVTSKDSEFSIQDFSILSGYVKFARYVDEKNPDGTAKMTREFVSQDGKTIPAHAKKPHFDISIEVAKPEGDGQQVHYVLHTVKCYDFGKDASKPGKTQVERLRGVFGDSFSFKDGDKSVFATIVTTPGRDGSYQRVVGENEYTNFTCTHMGIKSMDFEIEKTKEKDKAPEEKDAPASLEANTPNPFETPSGSGMTASMEEDPAENFRE